MEKRIASPKGIGMGSFIMVVVKDMDDLYS